ncbi:MAG: proline racemase family protein [Acidobacteriota bacterium]
MRKVQAIDSHTGGEPTRVVIEGGPQLSGASMAERQECMRSLHDGFRAAAVNEPRGSDIMVGALLCPPDDPASLTGVLFFNNVGYLGMCVHGTIGVVATLAYLGRIQPGRHRLETPVGTVTAELEESGHVSVTNVASYRSAHDVEVRIGNGETIRGDVAWGGNWFFLADAPQLDLSLGNEPFLTDLTWAIRQALTEQGISGDQGQEIDHIELFGPSQKADSKNFVLCPGKVYDRSPCGTGTSAKLACLYADGQLREGQIWRQESIVGSVFEGSVQISEGRLFPRIRGSAYVNAETTLILDEKDPFCTGIRS